jgi:hypothetical protein
MSESLMELATWYPLLPGTGQMPQLAGNILDLRICVAIPAGDLRVHGPEHIVETQGRAMLTASSPTTLTVEVTRGHLQGEWRTDAAPKQVLTVPVFLAGEPVPASTASYAICRQAPESERLQTSYEIHPNCLVFSQMSPDVTFMDRGPVQSTDGQVDPASGERINGAERRDPWSVYLPVLSFEDGYNVKVSGGDSLLVFTGTVGAGKGVWTESPFSDIPDWNTQPGRGLRSINGQTDSVSFSGSSTVNVRVHEELDNTQQVIVVELQPKSLEELP